MKFLLDTNVIKEIGKPSAHQNVKAWLDTVDDLDLAIGVISIKEIYKGIEALRDKKPDIAQQIFDATEGMLEAYDGRIVYIDELVAKAWGKMLGESNKHIDDRGLAACASVNGLVVVTRNIDDFLGLGVQVIDPFSAKPSIRSA